MEDRLRAVCIESAKPLAALATILYKRHALESSQTPFLHVLGLTDQQFDEEVHSILPRDDSKTDGGEQATPTPAAAKPASSSSSADELSGFSPQALAAEGHAAEGTTPATATKPATPPPTPAASTPKPSEARAVWALLWQFITLEASSAGGPGLSESQHRFVRHTTRQLFEAMMMRAAREADEAARGAHHGFFHDSLPEFRARVAQTVLLAREVLQNKDEDWSETLLARDQVPLSLLLGRFTARAKAFASSIGFSEELHPAGWAESLRHRDVFNHLRRLCPLAHADADPPFLVPLVRHLPLPLPLQIFLRNEWCLVVDHWRIGREAQYFSLHTDAAAVTGRSPETLRAVSLCCELEARSPAGQLHLWRAAAAAVLAPLAERERAAHLTAVPELLVGADAGGLSEQNARLLPWVEHCLVGPNRSRFGSLAGVLASAAAGRVVEADNMLSLLQAWDREPDADGIDVAEDQDEGNKPATGAWPAVQWLREHGEGWPALFADFSRQEESVLTVGAELVFYARLRGLWLALKEAGQPPAVRRQAVLKVCLDRLRILLRVAFLLLCAHQNVRAAPDEMFPEKTLPVIAAVREAMKSEVPDP